MKYSSSLDRGSSQPLRPAQVLPAALPWLVAMTTVLLQHLRSKTSQPHQKLLLYPRLEFADDILLFTAADGAEKYVRASGFCIWKDFPSIASVTCFIEAWVPSKWRRQ